MCPESPSKATNFDRNLRESGGGKGRAEAAHGGAGGRHSKSSSGGGGRWSVPGGADSGEPHPAVLQPAAVPQHGPQDGLAVRQSAGLLPGLPPLLRPAQAALPVLETESQNYLDISTFQ